MRGVKGATEARGSSGQRNPGSGSAVVMLDARLRGRKPASAQETAPLIVHQSQRMAAVHGAQNHLGCHQCSADLTSSGWIR